MEKNKAKRAPCKRVRENENLDSVESTSGSCSPKILRLSESETRTAVQLPPDNSSSSSHNNGFEISIKRRRRRRDRERLRRLNETEEQRYLTVDVYSLKVLRQRKYVWKESDKELLHLTV